MSIQTSTANRPDAVNDQPLAPMLTLLRQLYTPTGVLLVGAGNGTSPWVQQLMAWGQSNVTLVEADKVASQRLHTITQKHPGCSAGWQVCNLLVGPQTAPTLYYSTSLRAECGLLNPVDLCSLWPNISSHQSESRQAISLAELLHDIEVKITPPNWLLLDCLPALPLLKGVGLRLEGFSLIALRVLLDPPPLGLASASLTQAHNFLTTQGFKHLATEVSRHPGIGHALYVRDVKAQVQTETLAKTNALAERDTLAKEKAALSAAKDAETLAKTNALAERDTLVKEKAVLSTAKDAETLAKTNALAERDTLAKEKAALSAAKDAEALAKTNALAQRDTLAKEKAVLSAAKDAEALAKTNALAALEAEKKNRAQEKVDLLKAFQDKLAHEYAWLAHSCIISDDLHQSVQKIIVTHKLDEKDGFDFLVTLSDQLAESGDKVTALSYLNQARKSISAPTKEALTTFTKRLIKLGKLNEAEAVFTQAALDGTGVLPLSDSEKASLKKTSQNLHQIVTQKSEHGHDLLLSAFNQHLTAIAAKINGRKPVLIEIGTTREDVPGQGSTRKLADYCKTHSIDFITVDMDPHNSGMAQQMFAAMNTEKFQAIAMKGEDYLRNYVGSMDFVFLDAYDFDHGKHSELRQSRYEKFLGSRIDEAQCHQMHLDCAQSVAKKLSPFGLVCFDDTWLEDGKWTAKGTLGMPYLLANGFELVEAHNRAALLRRKTETAGICAE